MYAYRNRSNVVNSETASDVNGYGIITRTVMIGSVAAVRGGLHNGTLKDVRIFHGYRVHYDIVDKVAAKSRYSSYGRYQSPFKTKQEEFYLEVDLNGTEGNHKYSMERLSGAGDVVFTDQENVIDAIKVFNRINDAESKAAGIEAWNDEEKARLKREAHAAEQLAERIRIRDEKAAAKRKEEEAYQARIGTVKGMLQQAAYQAVEHKKNIKDAAVEIAAKVEKIEDWDKISKVVDSFAKRVKAICHSRDKFYCRECGELFPITKESYNHDDHCYDCGDKKDNEKFS